MRSLHGSTTSVNGAPTIDDIDASQISELVGYWKCSDATAASVPDHSGNGLDLILTPTPESYPIGTTGVLTDTKPIVVNSDGFMSLLGWWAVIAPIAGTALANKNNYLFMTATYKNDDSNSDTDLGTAWQGGFASSDAEVFQGINFGQINTVSESRIVHAGGTNQSKQIGNQVAGLSIGDEFTWAGGYKPSVSQIQALRMLRADGSITETDLETSTVPAVPASLPVQNDYFGYRATGSSSNSCPVKNIQLWSFTSAPVYMDETAVWVTRNPGRIPPWWIR